ncbi:MAG: hypothetical protein JWM88_444 [Verrucomicrobia bacterium]|nr:hypothetical protein [Verrucomicrobiota bacterium]
MRWFLFCATRGPDAAEGQGHVSDRLVGLRPEDDAPHEDGAERPVGDTVLLQPPVKDATPSRVQPPTSMRRWVDHDSNAAAIIRIETMASPAALSGLRCFATASKNAACSAR